MGPEIERRVDAGDAVVAESHVSGVRVATIPKSGEVATPARSELLRRGTILAFSAQALSGAAMALLVAVYLSKFYIDTVLLPAGILAVAIAVGRALDAMLDPCVGYLSDHTRTRWGRRKPWIFAGAIGNACAFYAMLVPPASLSGSASVWWFTATFMAVFVFTAMSQVPRTALGVELTLDTMERQRLFGIFTGFIAIGTIIGAILPTILQSRGMHDARTQMKTVATIYVTTYLMLNVFFLAYVPERREFWGRGEVAFVPGARRALRNRAFRVMFVSHVITAIPVAIPGVLAPFFVSYVMKLEGATWSGIYVLTYLTAGFLALPMWARLARKYGKLRVWLAAAVVGVTGSAGFFFVGPGDKLLMFAVEFYCGMASSAAVWLFLGSAMHADVIDYDELQTGKRREAQFSALWSIIPKFTLIPGAALPLALLGAVGYVPNLPNQSPEVVMTLRILFSVVPAALNAIGLSLMWWYPLTEDVHRKIREGVAKHARGETTIDPITMKELPPPDQRSVDEATAWFLDNFSRRELRAWLDKGSNVLTSVFAWAGGFGVLMAAGVWYAVSHVQRIDQNPGPRPALAIVIAGFSLSAVVFHLLRVKPALQLKAAAPRREVVESHLRSLE
jgi:glycoside/pentoside/hexuronide:cation symporter, GPH family